MPMAKEEYINWKATRGEAGTWNNSECVAADNLIRDTALRNLALYLDTSRVEPIALRQWIKMIARATFGSVETDEMLQKLNCYPDWM